MSNLTQHKSGLVEVAKYGLIPASWNIKYLSDIASIKTGDKDTQNKVDNGRYPFFVRSQKIERINSYSFDGEAVLTSGDGVGVGKIYHYLNGKFDYHQRVYNIHGFDKSKLHGKFFYYFFSQHFYRRVLGMSAKNSVDSVRMEMIAKMKIPLPPVPEQKKIATILGTWDKAIAKQEKLIAEKEDLKKGLMQQLLTGKKRFPGFADEWEVVRLGEVVEFKDGKRRPIKSEDRALMAGSYPYYGATGVIDYVNDFIFDEELILLGEDGENILSRNAKLVYHIKGPAWVNNHAHVMKVRAGYDTSFLAHYLEGIRYDKYNTGTAQPKLNKAVCEKIPLRIPEFDEQVKIGQTLSSADYEIEQLNTQLTLLKDQKKGLMQQLLTGKVRVKIDEE